MNIFKCNWLIFLGSLLLLSCSHVKSWKYDLLSFWSQSELKTYAFLSSESGWVACNQKELKGVSVGEQKSYLSEIANRNLTDEEQHFCALYRCSDQREYRCVNEGSYSVFSEVVRDIIQTSQSKKYLGDEKGAFNWELEEELCLKEADLNSCSIVSSYYLYRAKSRKNFFKIRKKECELLFVNESDCNYDF